MWSFCIQRETIRGGGGGGGGGGGVVWVIFIGGVYRRHE